MFQQVVRWTFIITIWKKYKGQLLTILGYLGSLAFVSFVHQDYLDYIQASGEGNRLIGVSFGLKWLAYLSLTGLFYVVFHRISKKTVSDHQNLGFLSKFRTTKGTSSPSKGRSDQNNNEKSSVKDDGESASAINQADPFANIRAKKTLRTEAELLLDIEQSSNREKGE